MTVYIFEVMYVRYHAVGICKIKLSLCLINYKVIKTLREWRYPVWWPGVKNSPNVAHKCRKRRLK
jgi:hypothetical protein